MYSPLARIERIEVENVVWLGLLRCDVEQNVARSRQMAEATSMNSAEKIDVVLELNSRTENI